jgi:hypothetical protein
MTDFSLHDEPTEMALTHDTLRAITTDLFARHADAESEWHLVQLLAEVVGAQDSAQPCSGPKLPASLVDVLIRVFATLEDRGAKLEAQRIINSYCTVQPASEAVKRVLVGLKSTDS